MNRFLFFFLLKGHVLAPEHEVVITAHVALGHEGAHVGNGGVELIWVVLESNNVQAGIERTANIPASAESANDNPLMPLPRPVVLRQKCLRQPIGLLMDVDRPTSTADTLGQHPLAWAHVMLWRWTEISDFSFDMCEPNQADLDGRSALVDGQRRSCQACTKRRAARWYSQRLGTQEGRGPHRFGRFLPTE